MSRTQVEITGNEALPETGGLFLFGMRFEPAGEFDACCGLKLDVSLELEAWMLELLSQSCAFS